MKQNIFLIILLFLTDPANLIAQELPSNSCLDGIEINSEYSRANEIQKSLSELVNSGVPGTAIAVYSEEGWWVRSDGYANIEDEVKMHPCHLQFLQSISKTYMATAVLKLVENGKIELDQSINRYLPKRYTHSLSGSERVTVGMLLNHTSGLPEYNYQPAYVTYLLQHPEHIFSPKDYLTYIDGKPLDFTPGSKYSYRNTNYVILALMVDHITGDHAQFIAETIFKPLGLQHTYYRDDPGYLHYSELPATYWDRYSNGIIENVTVLQNSNVASMIGDDGIVTTPVDGIKFLRSLLEGNILSDSTLEIMMEWVSDENGELRYSHGLDYAIINDQVAYGHSGGGIGAGSELYYFPKQDLYMFIGINLGTVTDSPLHEKASKAREKIFEALLH